MRDLADRVWGDHPQVTVPCGPVVTVRPLVVRVIVHHHNVFVKRGVLRPDVESGVAVGGGRGGRVVNYTFEGFVVSCVMEE